MKNCTYLLISLMTILFFPCQAKERFPSRINLSLKTKRLSSLDYHRGFKVSKFKKINKVRSRLFQKKPFKIVRYNTFEVELTPTHPSKEEAPLQKFLYLKRDDNVKRPLVILIPSIMEVTVLEKLVARGLIRRGFNVFLLYLNKMPIDNNRETSELFKTAKSILTGIRRTIDFAETRPNIDATKIGTWGNSFGGILNAFLAGSEPRIGALYISVAGGNFADILTTSQSTIAAPYREHRMEKEKLDLKNFKKKLKRIITIDPLDLAHNRSREDVYMNIDVKDTVVSAKHQVSLWEAFGRPRCRIFLREHFYAVIAANAYYNQDYFSFFEEKLLNKHRGLQKAPFGECHFKKKGKKTKSPYDFSF